VEKLKELEQMSREEQIDLYYGDETHVCSEGYVPYDGNSPGKKFVSCLKKPVNLTVSVS
jgi:hypothetical protein